jgi:hypothetical protein
MNSDDLDETFNSDNVPVLDQIEQSSNKKDEETNKEMQLRSEPRYLRGHWFFRETYLDTTSFSYIFISRWRCSLHGGNEILCLSSLKNHYKQKKITDFFSFTRGNSEEPEVTSVNSLQSEATSGNSQEQKLKIKVPYRLF